MPPHPRPCFECSIATQGERLSSCQEQMYVGHLDQHTKFYQPAPLQKPHSVHTQELLFNNSFVKFRAPHPLEVHGDASPNLPRHCGYFPGSFWNLPGIQLNAFFQKSVKYTSVSWQSVHMEPFSHFTRKQQPYPLYLHIVKKTPVKKQQQQQKKPTAILEILGSFTVLLSCTLTGTL